MGNILGKPQVIYITYGYDYSPNSSSSQHYRYGDGYEYEYKGGEQLYNCYDWDCCPWCGLYPVEQESQGIDWEGAVIGIVRRKGCTNRNHWALAFRSDIDVSQLPRRIKGYRTRIPSRCKRTCSDWQPVYIFLEQDSSHSSGSLEEAASFVAAE
ncbi:uncharacterized protein GGS22DRAFT_28349 [Annulohypoxylon maeteangense]|uniref:uncharacterized protein n=1 Tax=Annulohypoxylon maeteangense TaxID=1927788 RepID=UPI0020083D9A|nr:uncharacterized protein GGS22DRAFT_28349 [Annulohypoxylon maeteangense]KAI0883981.1 hypothetical protein GGS22DRAFT_28349 [Annulohypoxylon maeteangense]